MKYLDRYYVAYGSNINFIDMRTRCPWAKLQKIGTLNEFELVFKGKNGTAYLTVEPKESGKVPVVLWKVTQYDKDLLDAYEGYPNLYHIVEFDFAFDGKTYPCFMYVMNQSDNLYYELPTVYYYRKCKQGYEILELDEKPLIDALQTTIIKSTVREHESC